MLASVKKEYLITLLIVVSITAIFFFIKELKSKNNNTKTFEVENEELIYLKTKYGVVVIQTLKEVAPKTVARIKELTRKGFYNNNKFFRVIEGFVAQTGDPTNTGAGGSGKTLKAEFSNISHKRGIVSMARASNVNSADSQFFIVLKDSEFLDGKYTVWGKVISGMEYVDEIKKAKSGANGIVEEPDVIISMVLASDVEKGMQKINK